LPAADLGIRRPEVLSSDGSVIGGDLGAVPFGMDADWLLVFDAGGAPLLVDLAGPGVRCESADSLDVMEPVASVRLTDAPATVLPLPELPVAEIASVLGARTALAAASDAAHAATGDALRTHGGIGFAWEHPSHVLLKRARALADHVL
jgi:hypothetical protein